MPLDVSSLLQVHKVEAIISNDLSARDTLVEQPLVSVIITTYDRAAYLHEALSSALNQNYRNIEVIVSNDSGPESMADVVSSFNDERVHYFRHPTNVGVAANTLSAVRRARGTYIAFLNDDDVWGERFLEVLVLFLESDETVAIAFSDHYIIDEHGHLNQDATEAATKRFNRADLDPGLHRPFFDIALRTQSVPVVMAAVMRISSLNWSDFPVEVGPSYDFWIGYLASQHNQAAYYCSERLTYYRVHPGAETRVGRLRTSKAHIFIFREFLRDPYLASLWPHFRHEYAVAHISHGIALLRTGLLKDARRHLRTGLHMEPSPRVALALALSWLPGSWLRCWLPS